MSESKEEGLLVPAAIYNASLEKMQSELKEDILMYHSQVLQQLFVWLWKLLKQVF